MTLSESLEILKIHYAHLPNKSEIKEAVWVALDAIERTIDPKEWDAEESQMEEICNRCNGQGCSKCSK